MGLRPLFFFCGLTLMGQVPVRDAVNVGGSASRAGGMVVACGAGWVGGSERCMHRSEWCACVEGSDKMGGGRS